MKTLIAFIDMSLTAASYDFVTAMVRAMYERDRAGCDGLHIVFVPDERTATGFRQWGNHNDAATRWRFWHICMAAVPLAGEKVWISMARDKKHAELIVAAEFRANSVIWNPDGKQHFMGPLVEASRAGHAIPKLFATDAACEYVDKWFERETRPIVTLTMRDNNTDPDRNSSRDDCVRMAMHLDHKGYRTILIHDAHETLSNISGFQVGGDPDLRLALYERAAMNIIGNNGPQELLKFSGAPYLAFGQALTDGWQDHFRKHFSMEPGEQLPWARAHDQRLVYLSGTIENMVSEFEKWESTK